MDTTKLHIAMLGHKRIPSREGGIEVVVEELSTRIVQQGYQETCFNRMGYHVSGKEYDKGRLKNYKGIILKDVPTINRKGFAAMTSSLFGTIQAAFGKYDVVHFHAEGTCVLLWLPKLLGKRCICTIHGLDWQRNKWGKLASTYIRMGEKCAARNADEIIVLSKTAQRYFKDTYGRETRLIPNGVNQPQIRTANLIQQKYGLSKDTYLLYLGRIVPEKGLHCLIDAFREVQTDKLLVIAGGSSDSQEHVRELKQLAAEDKRILFTGFVQGELLDELYSNAYLYILPSVVEGMPLSLLEAMSYGNCCLVSDIEECTSIIEDKGFSFRKGDTADLTDKLQMICDHQEMVEQIKREAAGFVCRKYNWDDVVERTLALYEGRDG
jgi:glycosyltransferase involved in cell wall biosynthesis